MANTPHEVVAEIFKNVLSQLSIRPGRTFEYRCAMIQSQGHFSQFVTCTADDL